MDENDQYFQLFDLGQMKFLYTSKRIFQLIGVTPEEINPGHYTQLYTPMMKKGLGRPDPAYLKWRRKYSRQKKEVL